MKKILVTGGSGLVGKYLKDFLPDALYLSSKDCDLRDYYKTCKLFREYEPDVVIHLAAKVGGILDNLKYPVEYIEDNLFINTNIVNACHEFNVENLISVLSTCIYPDKNKTYPMKETDLFNGPPAQSNFSYAIAKRSMAAHISAYIDQYNKNWSCLIPSNLYGKHDNFIDDSKSHYVASLIKKIYYSRDNKINLWGTGKPLRQFMYAQDLAKIICIMIERNITGIFNVSPDQNYSIEEIARIALQACNKYDFKIDFDTSKPDGQYRKDVCSQKIMSKIPDFKFTPLEEGIKLTYNYLERKIKNNELSLIKRHDR